MFQAQIPNFGGTTDKCNKQAYQSDNSFYILLIGLKIIKKNAAVGAIKRFAVRVRFITLWQLSFFDKNFLILVCEMLSSTN